MLKISVFLVSALVIHSSFIHAMEGGPEKLLGPLPKNRYQKSLKIDRSSQAYLQCQALTKKLSETAFLHDDERSARMIDLIKQGADIDGLLDEPPIIKAVRENRYDVVRLLKAHGADLNIGYFNYDDTYSPLSLAQNPQMIELLLELSATNCQHYYSPLEMAAKSSHLNRVKAVLSWALSSGQEQRPEDIELVRTLFLTRQLKKLPVALVPVPAVIPEEPAPRQGWFSSFRARVNSYIAPAPNEAIEPLPVIAQDQLYNAASSGDVLAVRRLIAQFDVNAWFNSETALSAAIRNGHQEVAQILLSRGVDINGVCNQITLGNKVFNYTPLTYAIALGQNNIAEFLLQNGAGHDVRADGLTPMQVADSYKNFDMVIFLSGLEVVHHRITLSFEDKSIAARLMLQRDEIEEIERMLSLVNVKRAVAPSPIEAKRD